MGFQPFGTQPQRDEQSQDDRVSELRKIGFVPIEDHDVKKRQSEEIVRSGYKQEDQVREEMRAEQSGEDEPPKTVSQQLGFKPLDASQFEPRTDTSFKRLAGVAAREVISRPIGAIGDLQDLLYRGISSGVSNLPGADQGLETMEDVYKTAEENDPEFSRPLRTQDIKEGVNRLAVSLGIADEEDVATLAGAESATEALTGLLSSAGAFGGFSSGSRTAGTLAEAGVAAASEYADMPPWFTMAATVGSGIAARKLYDVTQVNKNLPMVQRVFTNALASSARELPKDVAQALKDRNIYAPVGLKSGSSFIQGLEARLGQSALAGEAPELAKTKIVNSFVDSYESIMGSISKNAPKTATETGVLAKDTLSTIKSVSEDAYKGLYNTAESILESPGVGNIQSNTRGIIDNLTEGARKVSKAPVPSARERFVAGRLNAIAQEFRRNGATVEELVAQRRSLNNLLGTPEVLGVEKYIENAAGYMSGEISDMANLNPTLRSSGFTDAWHSAERAIKEHGEMFAGKTTAAKILDMAPESAANLLKTPSRLNEVTSLLEKVPGGIEKANQLRGAVVESVIGNKISQLRDGGQSFRGVSSVLRDSNTASVIKNAVGENRWSELQKLQKVANAFDKGGKFLNASGSGVVALDATVQGAKIYSIGKFLTTADPSHLIVAGLEHMAPKAAANLLFNDSLIEATLDAAKNSGSRRGYVEAISRMGIIIQQVLDGMNVQEPDKRSN